MMMQWSNAIGNNCNLCHNSRNIYDWDESTPYPARRPLGPADDAGSQQEPRRPARGADPEGPARPTRRCRLRIECGTCHAGQNKPLGGFDLLTHYPFLGPKGGPTIGAADQAVRDTMHPVEVIGPAWSPLAKVVDVSIPAYPAPEAVATPAAPAPAAPAPRTAGSGSAGSGDALRRQRHAGRLHGPPRPHYPHCERSEGIRNGRSIGRSGCGIKVSTCVISSRIASSPSVASPSSSATRAEPSRSGCRRLGNRICRAARGFPFRPARPARDRPCPSCS